MVAIDFYNYTGKNNVINKVLPTGTTFNGVFIEPFNVVNPQIKVRATLPFNYNYCKVAVLNRYYFVSDCTILTKDSVLLTLSIDVLKSYENDILASTGTVTAKENANKYINTRENIHDIRPNFEKINFSVNTPFEETGNIIMITIKGNTN